MVDDELIEKPSHGLDEYWTIIQRRRWWILLPTFLLWAVAWMGSWVMPSVYQSDALVLVEQQKVPEQYVVPNVTVNLQDRLQSMTQQILSRTRLQATINRFHLYETHRGWWFAGSEDAVEQMRNDIRIELVEVPGRPGQLTSFKIRYSAGNPELAQQVNSELTSLFIDENLKSQQQLSEGTTAFLQSQLAEARVKLEEQEAKVRSFKATHFGNLPNQVETNVQILNGLENQLQSTQRALDGANQQKLYLESLLQQYRSIQASLNTANPEQVSPDTLNKDLIEARNRLQEARMRYTEDHPDVAKLRERVAKLEALKQEKESEPTSTTSTAKTPSNIDPAAAMEVQHGSTSPMMQVQSQLKANRLEIENYQQRERKVEGDIAAYQARLNITPQTEQQLADISRGYEESKSNYNSLLQKQNQSQLATSLEQRQQGEQFHILDPPSLPVRPSAPNHLLISLGGLVAGLAVGLAITALVEMINVRVRREEDLEEVIPLKVLVLIPHLGVEGEDHARDRFRIMEIAAMAIMAIIMLAGNVFAFLKS